MLDALNQAFWPTPLFQISPRFGTCGTTGHSSATDINAGLSGVPQVAIVVVDGVEGSTPIDEDVARLIQRDFLAKGIAVYLAVNKCEGNTMAIDLGRASPSLNCI